MVFHDFLGALLVFASLMQSFEELYVNLSLFLLSPKKKSENNHHAFKAEILLWSHLVPRVPLHVCKHLYLGGSALCQQWAFYPWLFSPRLPKENRIASTHDMPLTSNPWQSSGIIFLCSSAKHITLPSDPQEAAWENGEVFQGRD